MQALGRPLAYGMALAAVWAALAWMNDATYHLAPLLVGAVVPLGVALGPAPPARALRLAAAAVGAALALAAALVLALAGRLDGGSLLPAGGAITEAVVFSPAGAGIGLVLGLARRR